MALLFLPALVMATSCSSAETGDEVSNTAASSDSDAFAAKYVELRDEGKSHKAATELATLHVGGRIDGGKPAGANGATDTDSQRVMDAAIVLARYSSSDSYESVRREQAVEELRARFESRNLSDAEAVDLIDTIAPEAAINARREAARKIAELSQIKDEDWDGRNSLDAAEEIARLITGDRIHAEKRIEAARELTRRSKAGELDADGALVLMNDIAPGLSINERRQAAANLARLSQTEKWNAETTKEATEETYRLVTGGELNVERRANAAVDLTGEGIKRFGGDEFKDEEIDVAAEMIKSSLSGDLTTDKVSDLLGFDD